MVDASSDLPVVRSAAARTFFLASAAVTVGVLLWAANLDLAGLTPIFSQLFAVFDYQGAICMLLILASAVLIPRRISAEPLLRWIGARPGAFATASALLLCAGSLVVYRNHPLAMDEYAQYLQSEIFSRGHLNGQFPVPLLDWLIPKSFQGYFLVVSRSTGAVASSYWPSFALLLTPFTWLGIPWACNPIVSALTLLAIHRLALRIFADRDVAALAVLFTAASPVFFANGISYYSMPSHLLANTVFALLLLDPTPGRAALAGVVGSVALTLHNPVPHILFALPWLFWVARTGGIRALGSLVAGYAPLSVLLGAGWFWFATKLTADPATPGAHLHRLHDIAALFLLPSSTVLLARLIGIAKLWVWAAPGLLLLAGAGAWKWRHDAACRNLAASAVLTLLGYLLVPLDQGHGWGYRYFHSAWVALPLLGAGAFARSRSDTGRAGWFENDDTRAYVLACTLLTLTLGVGFRGLQIHTLITQQLAHMPAHSGSERRVVIIDPIASRYVADLVQNDPWLRGSVIRMLSQGAAADSNMMLTYFPEMHRVHSDDYGSVWSAAPAQATADAH